jgi:hypothetical protein
MIKPKPQAAHAFAGLALIVFGLWLVGNFFLGLVGGCCAVYGACPERRIHDVFPAFHVARWLFEEVKP